MYSLPGQKSFLIFIERLCFPGPCLWICCFTRGRGERRSYLFCLNLGAELSKCIGDFFRKEAWRAFLPVKTDCQKRVPTVDPQNAVRLFLHAAAAASSLQSPGLTVGSVMAIRWLAWSSACSGDPH